MKNLLLLVGVIGLGAGAVFLYKYLYQPTNTPERTNLVFGGAFFLVALICFAVFFFMRFREEGEQDISITKF
ncbi:MAG TPA: hypothetical protein VN743_07795 [Blastocatellia bacterium]|jgi:hypothetical protein|nr:hypothetical protein [Blastocatellia bacterium]